MRPKPRYSLVNCYWDFWWIYFLHLQVPQICHGNEPVYWTTRCHNSRSQSSQFLPWEPQTSHISETSFKITIFWVVMLYSLVDEYAFIRPQGITSHQTVIFTLMWELQTSKTNLLTVYYSFRNITRIRCFSFLIYKRHFEFWDSKNGPLEILTLAFLMRLVFNQTALHMGI